MTQTSRNEAAVPIVSPDKIYAEVRAGIRETDNISFKLLGLVPLVSGTALIALILQTTSLPSGLLVVLSLFAATVTLGLFRWELRNVQTCSWLIKYAEAIEERALGTKEMGRVARTRPSPPQRIGKTEAEKLIYTATIAAWLALPVAVQALTHQTYRVAYFVVASGIAIGTILSLFATARVVSLR